MMLVKEGEELRLVGSVVTPSCRIEVINHVILIRSRYSRVEYPVHERVESVILQPLEYHMHGQSTFCIDLRLGWVLSVRIGSEGFSEPELTLDMAD
jgi:hypothetical protein